MPALLFSLLPLITSLFAPKAQQAVEKISGQSPEVSGQFVTDLFSKAAQLLGIVAAGQPLTTQAQAVQTVAALQTAPAETVKAVEQHALDYLDKISPFIDKAIEIDKATNEAQIAGANAAAERVSSIKGGAELLRIYIAHVDGLTFSLCIGLTVGLLAAMALYVVGQYYKIPIPDWVPMILPVLSMVIGQIMGERKAISGFLTDGTPSSNAANAANAAIVAAIPKQ
jgi:hypothetical protein